MTSGVVVRETGAEGFDTPRAKHEQKHPKHRAATQLTNLHHEVK